MGFKRETIKDFYLLATDVENIFINEYMPVAPGDFVKVYLYGLLYSQNGIKMTCEQMAGQLSMSKEKFDEAWNYWVSMGIVEKIYSNEKSGEYDIVFKQMRSMMYSTSSGQSDSIGREISLSSKEDSRIGADADKNLCNGNLKELLINIEKIKGRSLSTSEIKEIFSLVEDDKVTGEIILGAMEYCTEKGKTGINYIAKVAREWFKEGLRTEEDIKARFADIDERMAIYKRILKTLGLNRGITEAEKEMVDGWTDDMKFNIDKILEACNRASFISSPNLRYVNRVLLNWYEEAKISGRNVNSKGGVTQAVLNKYYEYLRKKKQDEAEARRAEVYNKIPRIEELDKEMIELGQRLSRVVLEGNPAKLKEIKRLMKLLEEERNVLLTENNYREDYTDIKYACDKCSDTGITEDGQRCSCIKERMGEAELWQNSTLLKK